MDLKGKNLCYKRKSVTMKPLNNVVSDRKFLIDFIITTYLGPDVKYDNPRCSSFQRLISGLPSYNLNDLGSSYVSISLLEKLYYYRLKNALPELILDLNMFHMYLKGNLDLPNSEFSVGCQQFTSFFPSNLHQQIWYPDSFRIVKGVVLIDDPIVSSCVKEEDLNRFRLLSGVDSFKLDLSECLRVQIQPRLSEESDGVCVNKLSKESDGDHVKKLLESSHNEGCQSGKFRQECKRKYVDHDCPSMLEFPSTANGDCVNNGGSQSGNFRQECKRKYVDDDSPLMPELPHVANGNPSSSRMCESDGPLLMPLISIPDIDSCVQDHSIVLTGTANRGLLGPSVGVVDIGISKVAYLFRVSLPGVKREYSTFLVFLFSQVSYSSLSLSLITAVEMALSLS